MGFFLSGVGERSYSIGFLKSLFRFLCRKNSYCYPIIVIPIIVMAVTKVGKYWDITKILRKKRRPCQKKTGRRFLLCCG